ncbi:uncharacterized protein ACIBXB_014492 isoform 1-T2 [Morphnus guianensis]
MKEVKIGHLRRGNDKVSSPLDAGLTLISGHLDLVIVISATESSETQPSVSPLLLLLLLLSQPSVSCLAAILDLGRKPIGVNTATRPGSPHINYAENSGRSLQLP